MAVHFDASALVKLAVDELESDALRRFVRVHPKHVSSVIARVEVVRAVRNIGESAVARAIKALAEVDLLAVTDEILSTAAALDPRVLRTLDAIHVATAMSLGAELEGLVTYDARMAEAAQLVGIATFSPGVRPQSSSSKR